RYRHARWTGTTWQDRELTPAGSFFPEDGGEKQYSGGIVFDHANPAVVYLSRQVAAQWQIERWQTTMDARRLRQLPPLPHHDHCRVTTGATTTSRRGRALGSAENRLTCGCRSSALQAGCHR